MDPIVIALAGLAAAAGALAAAAATSEGERRPVRVPVKGRRTR